MAQRPDGKPARTERVTFTRPAAERIAKVVRQVEHGDRGALPLSFTRVGDVSQASSDLRVATFTGVWCTGETHEISFNVSQGTNSNTTAMAFNNVMPLYAGEGEGVGYINCIVGRPHANGYQTAKWHLLAFNVTQLPGYDPNQIQLFGHGTSTCSHVQWYSITTCSTATAT